MLTVIIPAFNEGSIIDANLRLLVDHLDASPCALVQRWELIIINDGSSDNTAQIAERWAERRENIRVIHHRRNRGLGQAMQTGFAHSQGDYVVMLDIDLSYSPDHIEPMLEELLETDADMVLASPYMKGGKLSNIPFMRRFLSVWANRFLSLISFGHLKTLTCMVRAYRGDFIRALNLRSSGMEVMPEIIYKTMVMGGRIAEVPAHLDWSLQVKTGVTRSSSMRIFKHIIETIIVSFVLRPFMFFMFPGVLLFLFAMCVNGWMFIHFFDAYAALVASGETPSFSAAVANAYQAFPHTFIVGLFALVLSIQLLSVGILSYQSKRYFEEIFNLSTRLHASNRDDTSVLPYFGSKPKIDKDKL